MPQVAPPSQSLDEHLVGDRFELGEKLGEGAMGAVYRAVDRSTERPCAVKVLHRALVTSREYVSRFRREALAASRFRHEAAVRVIGAGVTNDGLPFIAMDLVEGRTLREILDAEKRLETGRACNIAEQLLRALGAAHQRGIVHRDMKPDNVRVVVDADGIERPKILDFGVVKFIGGDGADVEGAVKTKTGVVVGTPKYMAPEQIRGEPIDGRADVYAVGAMLYEMLAGEPPFVADDVVGFVAMHLRAEVPPLLQRAPDADVPPELDVAVLHMLSKEPSARPADATALAAHIAQWAVEDPNAGLKERALKRAMAVVAASGVVSAVLGFVVAGGIAPAVAASAIGLGAGAAAAARYLPRPSVYGYAQRMGLVAGALLLAAFASLLVPGSPGLAVTGAHALAALLSYAAYLAVWSSAARWLRVAAAGVGAPLLALPLLPIRVVPASGEPYFVRILGSGSTDPALAALESSARGHGLAGVLLVALVFSLATLLLPRPAAARLS